MFLINLPTTHLLIDKHGILVHRIMFVPISIGVVAFIIVPISWYVSNAISQCMFYCANKCLNIYVHHPTINRPWLWDAMYYFICICSMILYLTTMLKIKWLGLSISSALCLPPKWSNLASYDQGLVWVTIMEEKPMTSGWKCFALNLQNNANNINDCTFR